MDSIPVNHITLLLGAAFITALLIERILEVLKAILDFVESKHPRTDQWNLKAIAITRSYLRDKSMDKDAPQNLTSMLVQRYLFTDQPQNATDQELVVDANQVRRMSIKARFKIIGVALGITMAFALDINLIEIVDTAQYPSCPADEFGGSLGPIREILGKLAMGIGMGLGAVPLNEMISKIESFKASKKSLEE